MKRLGFRSAFVSTEENAGARTVASQTTDPQLFYIEFYGKNKYFSNFFYLLFLQCQRTTEGETLCRWS